MGIRRLDWWLGLLMVLLFAASVVATGLMTEQEAAARVFYACLGAMLGLVFWQERRLSRRPSKSGVEAVKWEDKRPLKELLPQHKAALVVAYTFASVTGDEAMWKKWVEDGGRLHVVLPDFGQQEIVTGANLTTGLGREDLRREWERVTGFLRAARQSWQGDGRVELRLVEGLPSASLAVLYRRQSIDEGHPSAVILKTPRPRRGQEHVRTIEVHFDREPAWCEALAEYAQKYWQQSAECL